MSGPVAPEVFAADIVDLYERRAEDWIDDRGRVLTEADQVWLDRFTDGLAPGDAVLDVGCGSGRPMAAALLEWGFRVAGVDSSARLVAHATRELPDGDFRQADMRTLDLGRTFAGVLAWHSLFHLSPGDQRHALPRILDHAAPCSVVMFSSGPSRGHAIGDWRGEPLYHGSLAPEDYEAELTRHGFRVEKGEWAVEGWVWLARRDG